MSTLQNLDLRPFVVWKVLCFQIQQGLRQVSVSQQLQNPLVINPKPLNPKPLTHTKDPSIMYGMVLYSWAGERQGYK